MLRQLAGLILRITPGVNVNICQVITPSKLAGAERSTTSLCEHLQAAGHRVLIGCKKGSPLIDVMREVGLEVRPLPISGKLNLRGPLYVAALARHARAAVIHSQLSTAAWHSSFAGRVLGVPTVAHVRALNSPFFYRWATRVIAVSQAVKQHLVDHGLDGRKIDVVYNGIDPARYFLPSTRDEARRTLGLPAKGSVVGVVAHLSAKKGHLLFLDAFARIAARHPDTTVLFVGDGDERERLCAHVRCLGLTDRVIFAGFQRDVLPYYAAMDLVVLPSVEMEGLGRALQEGGLLRRPGIGTQLGGMPEVIRDGETGFIVPVGDVQALADRMHTLLEDPALREKMGAAAHEYITATFTVQAMVSGTLAVYERAGAGR
jgi:glycosyltransferase involved in cell wall biosynthesis